MTAQEQLRALLRRHHATIVDQVEIIGGLLSRVSDGDAGSASLVAKILDVAHQIKGSSGSIGFREVSDAAAALEGHLKATKGAPITSAQMGTSRRLFDALQQLAAETVPEKSTLYSVDLSQFRR